MWCTDIDIWTLTNAGFRVRLCEFWICSCGCLMPIMRQKDRKRLMQVIVRQTLQAFQADHKLIRLAGPYAFKLPHGFNGDAWTGAATMLSCPNKSELPPSEVIPVAIRYWPSLI